MNRFALSLALMATLASAIADNLRIHRIDKLGEHSPKSPRFDHTEARAEAKIVFTELAAKHHWNFSQSSGSEVFSKEQLKDIDVIIFDNNSGLIFNDAEKTAFENWVQQGGGVIGIHGASHAHKSVDAQNQAEWPFWYELWGVLHKTGPKNGPQGRRGYADWIKIIDQDKRWTEKTPERWQLEKVEWYFWNYHKSFENT